MLDLIKVSVVLTVQVGLRAARPSVSEGLPAPLVFEWEVASEICRGLSRAIEKRPQRVDPIGKTLPGRLSISIESYRRDSLHSDGRSDGGKVASSRR